MGLQDADDVYSGAFGDIVNATPRPSRESLDYQLTKPGYGRPRIPGLSQNSNTLSGPVPRAVTPGTDLRKRFRAALS